MSRSLFSWFSAPTNRKTRRGRQKKAQLAKRSYKPQDEPIERRIVPTVLDIRQSAGQTRYLGGSLFISVAASNFNTSTGTGVISPFLRVQKDGVKRGYNTGASSPTIIDPTATADGARRKAFTLIELLVVI